MKVSGYIGQAGTGKTTRIISELETIVPTVEWTERNSILAITFMHGSRRRLRNKLRSFERKGIKVECQTIDGLCLRLVQRYRQYLGISKNIQISDFVGEDEMIVTEREVQCGVNAIRRCAIKLMSYKTVRDSIAKSFPLVIIDEFQDCDGLLLNFVQEIASLSCALVAADDFQRLSKTEDESPSLIWLKSITPIVELEVIHRTSNINILNSALALRTKQVAQNSVQIIPVTGAPMAAWNIAAKVAWKRWGLDGSTLAIISPTKIDNDKFFHDTLARLQQPFENNGFPGTTVYVEGQKDETAESILSKLPTWDSITLVDSQNISEWAKIDSAVIQQASSRAKRLMNLRGANELSKQEFSDLVGRSSHSHKVYGSVSSEASKTALTVHQAKNREFDYVIVLWSYKSQGGGVYPRKLLYNGITRAKKDAIIIAQFNPSKGATDDTLKLLNPNYHVLPSRKKADKKTAKKKSVAVKVKRTK